MSAETARAEAAGRAGSGGVSPGRARPGKAAPLAPAASDVLRLTKPRITALVLFTAAAGFLAASGAGIAVGELFFFLVGTGLLAAGTNALNQVLERDLDARMVRTEDRPLPAGRMRPGVAAGIGVGAVGAGAACLYVWTNPLTAGLGLATAVSYAAVYTPLKRVSSLALPVGAVPGALPILGGWTAVRNGVDPVGWALFGVLFLWQLPHFLSLGWILREDYRRAGFAVLAVEADGERRSRELAVLTALALLPVSLLPTLMGGTGWIYGGVALAGGAAYLVRATRFGIGGTEADARALFRGSLWYLPLTLSALTIDVALGGQGGLASTELPVLNAGLNATAAVCLTAGYLAVRAGRIRLHRALMLAAAAASALFLASYLVYHATVGSVSYAGEGLARSIYLIVLGSHAVLAAAVLPLAIVTLARALLDRRRAHRRLARWTLPIWLYVSVSGLVVYAMLYGP